MSCCCVKTLNYCEKDICNGEIDFDVLVQSAGVHKMVVDFLGTQITILADLEVGEFLIFPITDLNEGYEFTANLYEPDGDKIIIRKDDVDYDCFKFKTVVNVAYI